MPQTQVKLREAPPNNVDAIGADMIGPGGVKGGALKRGRGCLSLAFAGVAIAAISYYYAQDSEIEKPVEKNVPAASSLELNDF